MKSYPHIDGPSKAPHLPCIAFHKYDGSNLRWEWSKKKGWYKFGTRNCLFDKSDPLFGQAIPVFESSLAEGIEKVLRDSFRDVQSAIVFTEFFGASSFAGTHAQSEPKELVLFDVNLYKKGIMSPRDFVRKFGHLRAAEVVYEGILNQPFIENVRNGVYPVAEGVVCKGGSGHDLWMVKVKTLAYLKKLKEVFHQDWQKYWE